MNFRCQICNMDLGDFMETLNDPEKVWDMHAKDHKKQIEGEIWDYLFEHKQDIPIKLQQLVEKRKNIIKKLVFNRNQLTMMIEDGSL